MDLNETLLDGRTVDGNSAFIKTHFQGLNLKSIAFKILPCRQLLEDTASLHMHLHLGLEA